MPDVSAASAIGGFLSGVLDVLSEVVADVVSSMASAAGNTTSTGPGTLFDGQTGFMEKVNTSSGSSGAPTSSGDVPGGVVGLGVDETGGSPLMEAVDPLILNLAGGKVHTTDNATSVARFDVLSNGTSIKTAWTTAGEGFLVFPSANGTVVNASNFVKTFAALNQYDLNHDSVINANDVVYSQLRVWVNAAGDGVFRPSDLKSLSQLGVASINLTNFGIGKYDNGNAIVKDGSFTFANGTTGDIAQVTLLSGNTSHAVVMTASSGGGGVVRYGARPAIQYITGIGQTFNIDTLGVSEVIDLGSNNIINIANTNGLIVVGGANSTINAGNAMNATIISGHGTNINGGSATATIFAEGDGGVITTANGVVNNIVIDSNGNQINAWNGAAMVTVNGNSNTGNIGNSSTVTVAGISNALNIGSAARVFITVRVTR